MSNRYEYWDYSGRNKEVCYCVRRNNMRILRLCAYYAPELIASSHLEEDMGIAFQKNQITSINYTPIPTRGISGKTRREYKYRNYEEMYDGYVIVHRFSMFKERKKSYSESF